MKKKVQKQAEAMEALEDSDDDDDLPIAAQVSGPTEGMGVLPMSLAQRQHKKGPKHGRDKKKPNTVVPLHLFADQKKAEKKPVSADNFDDSDSDSEEEETFVG